jgi:hypothetical protein
VQRAIVTIRTWLRENIPGFANLKLSDGEIIENTCCLQDGSWKARWKNAKIVCRTDFPKAVRLRSATDGKDQLLWKAKEVMEWADRAGSLNGV